MMIFLVTFLLMLLSGSIFILGFHTITRGKKLILPNGKEEVEKEIFGDWQLFWEDVKDYKKVYYEGKQLENKLKILEQSNPQWLGFFNLEIREQKSLVPDPKQETDGKRKFQEWEIRDIEWHTNTNVLNKEVAIFLYDEFPVYRFPEWVRKITNCHICLSSTLGTFSYWTLLYFFPAIIPTSGNSTLCKIIFWVVYCISLAFVNKSLKENFDIDKNK